MEYISKQYLNQHPYTLPIAGIIHWLIFYVRQGHTVSDNQIVKIMLVFNLVTMLECAYHPQNVIGCALVLQAIVGWKKKLGQFWGMVVFVLIWPEFAPILALKAITSQTSDNQSKQNSQQVEEAINQQKANKSQRFQCITILLIGILSIYYLHNDKYFPKQYSPHSGISWLLYSHMFKNYLLLYQMIFMIVTFVSVFPLMFINCKHYVKLAILWFISIYMMNNISFIHIWVLYYLQKCCYKEIMRCVNKNKQIIWNLLSILLVIISICSLVIYERLKQLWMSSHFISIGYVLVQGLLFWGTHAVYLSQALIILDKDEKKSKSLKERIKQYIVRRIKQL